MTPADKLAPHHFGVLKRGVTPLEGDFKGVSPLMFRSVRQRQIWLGYPKRIMHVRPIPAPTLSRRERSHQHKQKPVSALLLTISTSE